MERTICETHRITDSSRTHGTQHAYKDSTPSAGLYVRLLTPVNFSHIRYLSIFYTLAVLYFYLSPSFFYYSLLRAHLRLVRTQLARYPRSLYLGAYLIEAYLYGPCAQDVRQTSA